MGTLKVSSAEHAANVSAAAMEMIRTCMGPRPAGIVHGIFSRSKPSLVQGPFMFAPPQPSLRVSGRRPQQPA
jgi:hypothetical protein